MQQSCYSISHIGKCAEIAQMIGSNEPRKIFLNSDTDFLLLPACWEISIHLFSIGVCLPITLKFQLLLSFHQSYQNTVIFLLVTDHCYK